VENVGSPSIAQPDYWWYRARADLLRAAGTVARLDDFWQPARCAGAVTKILASGR
jgi:hypothetical protein